jgi:translocator protein
MALARGEQARPKGNGHNNDRGGAAMQVGTQRHDQANEGAVGSWVARTVVRGSEALQRDGDRSTIPKVIALASFAALTMGAAAMGRVANPKSSRVWYRTLRKPPFQPPSWVFAPTWTALYGLMAASGYRVWKKTPSKHRTRALALWGTQLVLNGAWSPLFFGARRKRAAMADLIGLLGAVAAYTGTARKVDKSAAAMMVPYLGWLAFAGLLNEEIIRRNRWLGR